MDNMSELISDTREYGLGVAFYNFRWNLAYGMAKFLVRRPLRMSVSEPDEYLRSDTV